MSSTRILERPRVRKTEVTSADTVAIVALPAEAGQNIGQGRRIFYGWYMLLMAMAASIATSPGQTFGVSIFNEPLRLELGLTHGQLGLAYTLGTLLGATPIIWIGFQMDRRGIRATMLAVICFFSIACLVMAGVRNWYHLVIAFTLLRMLGPGALSLLSGNILPFWFSRKLGTVEGLRQTAMAVAMAVIPPLNVWLVATFGWRNAYAGLGIAIWLILFPLYWRFFRGDPSEVAEAIDGQEMESRRSATQEARTPVPESHDVSPRSLTFAEMTRTGAFWIVLLGTSLFGMIQTGVFFCLVPIFGERGWTEQQAASMLMLYAVSLASHQVIGGRLADRLLPRVQLTIGMGLFATGLALLWWANTVPCIMLSGAILGSAHGIYFAAAHPLWARYFGRLHLGKLRGVQMATNVGVSSIGPLLVGLCRDLLGGFAPVLLLFSLLPLPFAFASAWVAQPTKRNTSKA